jgi:predicted Zn-dependent peptidase
MKGSLMLSLESSHSRMSKLAKDELIHGSRVSLEEILRQIDRVKPEHIDRVGRELFRFDRLSITGLGPISGRTLQAYG